MTDKTTLTRYANWCAVSHRHDLVPDPQNGHWVLFREAHAIEQERDMLLAAIDSDDVNWLTALRDIRRAMRGYKK